MLVCRISAAVNRWQQPSQASLANRDDIHPLNRDMTDQTPLPEDHPAAPILDALRSRRSIFNFLPESVPDDLLRLALDAGRFAPNHKLTEPWRFIVVGPQTRRDIEEAWADFAASRLPADASRERREETKAAALAKWRSKPAVVIVTQKVDADPLRAEEDYAAVASAIQNIQLAAWSLGLGCQWSTSAASRAPEITERLGIPSDERVVGLLYIGYPAVVPNVARRPLEEVTRWLP